MQKTLFLLCSLAVCISSLAAELQSDLDVTLIPDSLKKNAYAVVRSSTTIFESKSATTGVEKHTIAITILDKKGESLSEFSYPGDQFRSLKSFSAKMYDAKGNLLRKYKMSDVSTSEWSNSLATDAVHYGFACDPPFFPFTIVYEFEVGWDNGVLVFPTFYPQEAHHLSVEKARYQLRLPEGIPFISKAINMPTAPEKSTIKGMTTYEWNIRNLTAIEQESLDPDLETYIPILYTSPQNFIYDKVPGMITDWESMGKWIYGLTQNRDLLSEETKVKLMEMTKNAKSDREKVKILYDYLGETTHYVSIQLGIGGYQPMLASEVCKTRFGDCKGLSNYLKAMLTTVGIASNYCVIQLDPNEKTLYPDYANFVQPDHVIVQVPLPGDTLWLECTNPKVPFGFVHNGISGHDVLVCTAEGGKIRHINDYPDSLNIEQNNAIVEVSPDGSANVSMQKKCFVKIYDNYDWFPLAKASEQADNLRKEINLPNVTMGTIEVRENKSPLPCLSIKYTWNTAQFGNNSGNRLFIPANLFRSTYEHIKRSKRVHDMQIITGFKDVDSICIRIPKGYNIETMPSSCNLSTPFGTIKTSIRSSEKEILIKQDVFVPAGSYNVSSYPEFIGFFEKISAAYKGKIILKKQAN